MNINYRFLIQLFISIIVAVLLVMYIFSTVKFEDIVSELQKANYFWIILSVIASMLAHLSRAARWKLLLKPLGYNPSLLNSFQGILIGYLANYAVPRLGEVGRCSVLKKTDDIPINVSLGSVISERVVDLTALLVILMGCFIFEFQRLNDFFKDLIYQRSQGIEKMAMNGYLLILILSFFVLILSLTFFIYTRRNTITEMAFVKKILDFIKGIIEGMLSITKMENMYAFLLNTVFIWFAYFLMTYLIFFSLPDTAILPIMAGWVALALGSLGMVAPVQGGIGAYHIMVSAAMLIYGITQEKGLIIATILHSSQFIATVLVGGICLLNVLAFSKRKKDEKVLVVN